MADTKKALRVVGDEDLKSVAGGLLWVHVARTAAVIIAGAVTVIREGTKSPEAQAPDLSGLQGSPEETGWRVR